MNNNEEKNGFKGLVDNVSDMANDYISDEDNQKKMKKTGKTALKILGGGVIAYVIVGIIVFAIAVSIIIFAFNKVNAGFNELDDVKNSILNNNSDVVDSIINDVKDEINSADISEFNNNFENTTGSCSSDEVISLLEDTINIMNKYSDHSIVVVYGSTVASNTSDIRTLKNSLSSDNEYEVYLGYDDKGYVNKITVYDK